jgi:hypothetical protein
VQEEQRERGGEVAEREGGEEREEREDEGRHLVL